MLRNALERPLFHNPLLDYGVALGIFLSLSIVLWILKKAAMPRLKAYSMGTSSAIDDFIIQAIERTLYPLFYFGAFYFSARSLTLNPAIEKGITSAGAILLTFCGARFLLLLIHYALMDLWVRRQPDPQKFERHIQSLMPVISVMVWGLGIVFLLENLGFRISAIVTGLGIGGVAVALASQTVLADMFSYFAIMLDRPFELDDFIIIGDFMGTVEHIGIKTTRLRSLGGEELVFSNKDLTDSRVRNYKRMQLRRVVFKLGVTYDTSVEKLKKAVTLVKRIITTLQGTRFDRAHFSTYGDFSLVIEVVYYVLSADYNKYMDIQQEINLAIKEAFEKEQIEFAFPTQTILMPSVGTDNKEREHRD